MWTLLQPRDFINSHQLILTLGLLVIGILVASISGQADLTGSAPAVADLKDIPKEAPPIFPFLFITIACGAISGFHCLVSSGTSSKQLASEQDAQYVGYGAMLLEGGLAVVVIIACCAGVGMGRIQKDQLTGQYQKTEVTGVAAWKQYYPYERTIQKEGGQVTLDGWSSHKLGDKLRAFIEGGANFLTAVGIPLRLGIVMIAVLVASFAATTLDTTTRLQRYVVQSLAASAQIKPLQGKYAATGFALLLGFVLAMIPNAKGVYGTGGMLLWPLFGAINQLLAGLAFMVIVFYLWRRSKPILFALIPMMVMLLMPAWALIWQLFHPEAGWIAQGNYLLMTIGIATMGSANLDDH